LRLGEVPYKGFSICLRSPAGALVIATRSDYYGLIMPDRISFNTPDKTSSVVSIPSTKLWHIE